MDVQSLANRFVRLDISEPSPVLAFVVAHSSLLEKSVQQGGSKEVEIGDDGVMQLYGWIFVLNVYGLRELILEKTHSSCYSIQPSVMKMYRDLKQHCEVWVSETEWVVSDIGDTGVKEGAHHYGLYVDYVCTLHSGDDILLFKDISSDLHPEDYSFWDQLVPLEEFTYNNNYRPSIQMASYEVLYVKQCHCLVGWFEPSEARLLGTYLVRDALEKVNVIQERLHTTQSSQKSYANRRVRDVAYMEGEKILL
uniref:Uncharacterized protein LOC104217393 n=1 Tax=Nicotiana sylvestris TaxID=4096 RepID=A0A1U7VCX5_NICSY|nr:PREDICTED: uncharacterized protein LOC104217393 [Nicotiana sylvestris]